MVSHVLHLWLDEENNSLRFENTQGKRKCPQEDQRKPCNAQADKTRRAESQVNHHSATEPTVADGLTPPEPPKTNSVVNYQTAERTPAANKKCQEKDNLVTQCKILKRCEEIWTVTWQPS